MNEILIPALEQIAAMSLERCCHERMRLKNEISFARGNALWCGPSGEEQILAYKHAIEAIDERLAQLTHVCSDAAAGQSGPACGI